MNVKNRKFLIAATSPGARDKALRVVVLAARDAHGAPLRDSGPGRPLTPADTQEFWNLCDMLFDPPITRRQP